MLTDKDIAGVCAAIYSTDPIVKWDRVWNGGVLSNGIYAALAGNVFCFRGSVTQEDWFRDLDALSVQDPLLGGLHAGFAIHIHQLFNSLSYLFNENTIVCGHSLGAARALILAGYMMKANIKPKAVITFGSPRPGFQQLTEILEPVTVRSYCNRCDPVTDVPLPIFPDFPYIHPRQPIQISVRPPADKFFDLLADHSIALYAEGVPATEIS